MERIAFSKLRFCLCQGTAGKLCRRAAHHAQGHAPCLRCIIYEAISFACWEEQRFSAGGRHPQAWIYDQQHLCIPLRRKLCFSGTIPVTAWRGLQVLGIKGSFGGQEGSGREVLLALLLTCSVGSGALAAGPNAIVLAPLFHIVSLDSSTAGPVQLIPVFQGAAVPF